VQAVEDRIKEIRIRGIEDATKREVEAIRHRYAVELREAKSAEEKKLLIAARGLEIQQARQAAAPAAAAAEKKRRLAPYEARFLKRAPGQDIGTKQYEALRRLVRLSEQQQKIDRDMIQAIKQAERLELGVVDMAG